MPEGNIIQFTTTQFILLLLTIIGASAGASWKIGKYLSEKEIRRIDDKFEKVDTTFKEIKNELSNLRGDIAGLKADIKYLQGKFDMYLTIKTEGENHEPNPRREEKV